MRLLLVPCLLIVASLAGCAEPADEGPTPGPTPASGPFTTFLCATGTKDAYSVPGGTGCNFRVTKPLLDAGRFDWTGQHGPANEVSIAADPTDPRRVIIGAKDYTVSSISEVAGCGMYNVWMGTFWSTDGGRTWGNDLMPGFPGDPRGGPLSGSACNTDPVLLFDDDGTAWYSGLNYGGARNDTTTVMLPGQESDLYSGSQVYFAKSMDGGATYQEFTFAAFGNDENLFHDKQWFAAQSGGDHMVATWSPIPQAGFVGANTIQFSESIDGGATWTPPRPFTAGPGGAPVASQFAMPAYLPESQQNDVAFIFYNFAIGRLQYGEALLTPAGMQPLPIMSGFSTPFEQGTAPSAFRTHTMPILAVDTSGGEFDGRRYIVYQAAGDGLDVMMRTSDDGSAWSEAFRVDGASQGDQFMPWIDIDAAGGVHVVWYDKRHDGANRLMDVYHAYSDDGGATFQENRITEVSFDGDKGYHQNGSPFIGDYIQVDALADTVYLTWADTRHAGEPGRPAGSDVYMATLLRGPAAAALLE